MPVTIKVNGTSNSLVHKMSNGITTATIPDVCKTPTPGGPAPMPYPNIAQSITLSNGTTSVKGDRMMAANKGSKFALSNGDNPGVAGGIKSSTFMKEATWILYSFDVKLNGKNASRFTDKMFHNSQNAANLAGELQMIVYVGDEVLNILCNIFCTVLQQGKKSKKKPFPYSKNAQKLANSSKKVKLPPPSTEVTSFKDLLKKHSLVPERSVLASVPSALAGTRRAYTPAMILGRMGRKVAQGVASGVFAPIVNVAGLVMNAAATPLGTVAGIASSIPAGHSVVRIRPDIAVTAADGRISKIYDYKFPGDEFRNGQDDIYREASGGRDPQAVDEAACNNCAAA